MLIIHPGKLLTMRLRAIGVTIGMVLLAGVLPIGAMMTLDSLVSQYLMPFQSAGVDFIYIYFHVLVVVITATVGATFWYATRRLRVATLRQIWLEGMGLALGILLLGPILAGEAQALANQITLASGMGNFYPYAPTDLPSGLRQVSLIPPNQYLSQWQWSWSQLSNILYLVGIAFTSIIFGTITVALAYGMARWPKITVAGYVLPFPRCDLVITGGAAALCIGGTFIAAPLAIERLDLYLSHLPYVFPFLLVLCLLLLPAIICGAIACAQLLNWSQHIGPIFPVALAAASDEQVEYSVGPIPD